MNMSVLSLWLEQRKSLATLMAKKGAAQTSHCMWARLGSEYEACLKTSANPDAYLSSQAQSRAKEQLHLNLHPNWLNWRSKEQDKGAYSEWIKRENE